MRFAKYEGLGNDFVVVEAAAAGVLDVDRIRRLCDRRFGVGADGVLVVEAGAEAPWRMTVHNADGSRPEMCGNGLRCVVRYLRDRHPALPARFVVETDAGPLTVEDGAAGVGVDLGAVADAGALTVEADGRAFTGRWLSLGNPHYVMFGAWSDAEFHRWGPQLTAHRAFPAGANISFAEVEASDRIRLRVWERGAGPTLACGTGATATAAAAWLERRVEGERVAVDLPGGRLWIEGSSDALRMWGPAREVFVGEWRG
ncbi:MAG: diaminopimelate epimerase [Myxococcales bacterium]|nr:diaminopimelate epimerase [Myxococcales bacterium]